MLWHEVKVNHHCFPHGSPVISELCCVCVCSVESDSLRPHGLQPARLLCPWNFPGKILEWVAVSYSRLFQNHSSKKLLFCHWITFSIYFFKKSIDQEFMQLFLYFLLCSTDLQVYSYASIIHLNYDSFQLNLEFR